MSRSGTGHPTVVLDADEEHAAIRVRQRDDLRVDLLVVQGAPVRFELGLEHLPTPDQGIEGGCVHVVAPEVVRASSFIAFWAVFFLDLREALANGLVIADDEAGDDEELRHA